VRGKVQILQKIFTKHSLPFFYYHKINLRLGISIFEQLFFLCFLKYESFSNLQTLLIHCYILLNFVLFLAVRDSLWLLAHTYSLQNMRINHLNVLFWRFYKIQQNIAMYKKSLKIPKGQSESVYRRRTDKTKNRGWTQMLRKGRQFMLH
jgi:hypothetical protein